jgi:hypothetical protein
MSDDSTTALQYWLSDVIMGNGSLTHKLDRVRAKYQVSENDVVVQSKNIPVHSRLHVYSSGYLMRLKECLAADFPILKVFLGDEVFSRFADAAILHSPSASYSLYDLGLNFINFLTDSRPKDPNLPDEIQSMLDLPLEIAKTERARQEVMRAHGTEHLPPTTLSAADVLFSAHQVCLQIPESARLLELQFAVKPLIEAVNKGVDFETPARVPSYLAICRITYRVHMHQLEAWQYHFLNACKTISVHEAAGYAASAVSLPLSEILARLSIWLPVAVDQQLVIIVNHNDITI